MRRVLVTGGYNIGKAGVATIVYRWGQNFDSNEVVYDYLMAKGLPEQSYVEEIQRKGGKILAPSKPLRKKNKLKWMLEAMKSTNYEVLHINIDVAYKAMIFILLAKKAGIKKIVLHSHCAFVDDNKAICRKVKTIMHYMSRRYCVNNSTKLLACSREAALWMFGKHVVNRNGYQRIFNGLDIEQFTYDKMLRDEYRKELDISENTFVMCNIGRFSYQKNHHLLIDIFEHYLQKNSDAILILIGTGELELQVKEYVADKHLCSKVLFLGQRSDVNRLLNMMDVFVLPSRFEGLPLVLVEAQMNLLPCVIADTVSKESKISEFSKFVSGQDLEVWGTAIHCYCNCKRENLVIDNMSEYSIQNSAFELQKILVNI